MALHSATMKSDVEATLERLGVDLESGLFQGSDLKVATPITGEEIASLKADSIQEVQEKATKSAAAFKEWRYVPAPQRGELLRIFADVLREHKADLGKMITFEVGKTKSEAEGEVQEMIDILGYAQGLSRRFDGRIYPSERRNVELHQRWEPVGPVGVITAFNFPAAVWSWNAALALMCGDTVMWKPSELTPLTALACQSLFEQAVVQYESEKKEKLPEHISQLVLGGREVGAQLVADERIELVSATGSTAMGKAIRKALLDRKVLSRDPLLELGGNNPITLGRSYCQGEDLENALKAVLFGVMGTTGQRCTSTRRLFVPEEYYDQVLSRLKSLFQEHVEFIGDPRDPKTQVGPLIHEKAFDEMQASLRQAETEGGTLVFGGARKIIGDGGAYGEPALVGMRHGQTPVVMKETFAPILYVMPYKNIDDAIAQINEAPQGLTASIFTHVSAEQNKYRREVVAGGINVNLGTSGAEIGLEFGGEKDTGGGRESGGNAWQRYMRTVGSAIADGETTLAQGVQFGAKKTGKVK